MRKYGKRLLAGILAFTLAVGSAGCAREEKQVKKDLKSQIVQSAESLDNILRITRKICPAG